MADEYRFRRVLLKLSGEALMGDVEYGIDPDTLDSLAKQNAADNQLPEAVKTGTKSQKSR